VNKTIKAMALVAASALLIVETATARILNVPEEFETIRDGIRAAEDGDTVLVAPGVYEQNVSIYASRVVLASHYLLEGNVAYLDSTIIRGSLSIESPSTIIGFTVLQGTGVTVRSAARLHQMILARNASDYAGAVSIFLDRGSDAAVEVSHLIMEENIGRFYGGMCIYAPEGTQVHVSNSIIRNNINQQSYGGGVAVGGTGDIEFDRVQIVNNVTQNGGGAGFYSLDANPVLRHCLIAGNSARTAASAMHLFRTNAILSNVTVADNTTQGGSSAVTINGSLQITNSILWRNIGWEVWGFFTNNCSVTYSLIDTMDGGIVLQGDPRIENLLYSNPLFLDPDNGDYRLSPDSPCIDAGDPDSPPDPDGTRADIGAFYFHQRDIDIPERLVEFPPTPWEEISTVIVPIRNVGGTILTLTDIQLPLHPSFITFIEGWSPDEPRLVVPGETYEWPLVFHPQREGEGQALPRTTLGIVCDDPDEPEIVIEASGDILSAPGDEFPPTEFRLLPPYPNPFNSTVTLRFSIPINREATVIGIYDLTGHEIARLLETRSLAYSHSHALTWDASGAPAGVYVARLESGGESRSAKMVLLK